jgi:phospholipid/cholesterol/gamma-HCH transport system permease protein
MPTGSDWINAERSDGTLTLRCRGDWTAETAGAIDRDLRSLGAQPASSATIDVGGIGRLDTTGAWLIERTRRALTAAGSAVETAGADDSKRLLLDRLSELAREPPAEDISYSGLSRLLYSVGNATIEVFKESVDLLNFLGLATLKSWRVMASPKRFRFTAFVAHLENAGFNALPIVGLLSFVIGIVLAYQGADQLRRFGAEIFTVDLLGISILREMAILMTAIIIAGRSGSAFTAQIGTMQVNEEIDAMRTIGLDPVEVLVLPRAFALIVALPLLTIYADFMGLLGGAAMAMAVLDITSTQFVERLHEAVPLWAFWVGLIKAPIFGFVIALIGCREGLKVSGSAESVGRQTTRSVVISIFMIMVLDGIFSVFFSTVGV